MIVTLESCAVTPIGDICNRSCRAIRSEDLRRIVALPARTLEDAFRRGAAGLGAEVRPSPVGRGRWRLYARSAEAADHAIAVIVRALGRR